MSVVLAMLHLPGRTRLPGHSAALDKIGIAVVPVMGTIWPMLGAFLQMAALVWCAGRRALAEATKKALSQLRVGVK